MGIVFDTCVGEGLFSCGTARATGYRFRYPQWRGAYLAFLGIVFDTYGYGERRTENGKRKSGEGRVSFSIPVITGACFLWGWVLFSIPMRAEEISSTGSISLCVSGIVFDTCGCGGAYMCVGGAKVVGKISPPQKRVLRRVKSNF